MFPGAPQHTQAHTSPITVAGNSPVTCIDVGLGRDMTLTFRGSKLVMMEVNGLQYAPINNDQHEPWFKALVKGGLDPILKDAPVIETMILNYLFDAAIKTRMGEAG